MTRKRMLVFISLLVIVMVLNTLVVQAQAPDADGDGVPDIDDDCPNQPGPRENNGCPYDSDGDGLDDNVDNCPQQAGPRENGGCPIPDSDGDGIGDDIDYCPNEAGPRENGGCPVSDDADGDGVPDAEDNCPDESGVAENGGCPQSPDGDGDGIADDRDICPSVAGPAGTGGCPLPTIPETGDCVVATAADFPVNMREIPSTQGAIAGTLDPLSTYPIDITTETSEGLWYHVIGEAWVAGWVVRTGGECEGLPRISAQAGGIIGGPAIRVAGRQLINLGGDEGDAESEPDGQIIYWSNNGLTIAVFLGFGEDGTPFVAFIDPEAAGDQPPNFPPSGETEPAVILAPGSSVGFNPQPEPPGILFNLLIENDEESKSSVVVYPGTWEGFTPQPEPPGDVFNFLLKLNFAFDGQVPDGPVSVDWTVAFGAPGDDAETVMGVEPSPFQVTFGDLVSDDGEHGIVVGFGDLVSDDGEHGIVVGFCSADPSTGENLACNFVSIGQAW